MTLVYVVRNICINIVGAFLLFDRQVRVWSTIKLKVTVVNDEQDLQELEHFSIWKLVQYFVHEQTNETTVSVSLFNSKTCFRVDPSDSWTLYTVQPSRRELKTFLKERRMDQKAHSSHAVKSPCFDCDINFEIDIGFSHRF